jgi:CheY-like chemotaxis protein
MVGSAEEKQLRVLVVDDDPSIVTVVTIILSAEGFDVLEATSGEEGLELARKTSPDIILLDIMMPEIGGFEVYSMLRLDPVTADIPIMFLTASMKPEHISRSTEIGACGYIIKPFSPPALVNALREACRLGGESSIVLKSF